MAEFTYTPTIITITNPRGGKTKAFCLATEYEGRTLYACRDGQKGQSPIWARSEAKAESLSRKCGALALWETFSGMFEYGVELGYVSQAKAKPARKGPRMLDEAPAKPARKAKPSREAKVVPFITPEVVEEVEATFHQGLFDEIEADAADAFDLTPELVVSCWGDADALMGLCEAAGVETGRTKSASGLGGLLMAALQ
jgi:hypothetical protein